jgi:hypothetical protein
MKIINKLKPLIYCIIFLVISYGLCSTHEKPNTNGYYSRRKMFCSTPLYILILVAILLFIFINI